MAYKGMMLSGVPNMAFTIGYTNASWTLKADLVSEFVCRVLNYMDAQRLRHRGAAASGRPASTSVRSWTSPPATCCARWTSCPRPGHGAPWRLKQNYLLDLGLIRHGKVDDEALHFTKHRAPVVGVLVQQG